MARKMKDSGIEWIGEIPEGWEITKIKHIVSSVTDTDHFMPDSAEFGIPYLMIGDLKDLSSSIDWDSSKKISIEDYKKLSIKSRPQIGDIIFARYASIGTTCYIDTDRDFLVSYACLTIHPSDLIIGKFLSYYLKSSSFAEDVLRRTNSNTQGNVGKDSLVNATIVLPSIIEQTQIVNFLDAKCSDINAMLSKTRSSIEEYKKLKQAVITQAVTKGVRGEREMKDSGVGWIGAIPKDWEIKRLKSFCTIVDCKNRTPDVFPDGKYTVVRTTCIKDCSFSYEGSYQTDTTNFKAWTLKGQPHKGDIFFTREAPVGEACLVPNADNLCMGQRVMFFRPEDNSDARYIMYSIYGPLVREYIASKNSGSTVGHLKLGQVACIPIFYCPPLEQKEIADYLDAKCAEIAGLIAKKEQLVKELENYKKSLIYEVVTGKREV